MCRGIISNIQSFTFIWAHDVSGNSVGHSAGRYGTREEVSASMPSTELPAHSVAECSAKKGSACALLFNCVT